MSTLVAQGGKRRFFKPNPHNERKAIQAANNYRRLIKGGKGNTRRALYWNWQMYKWINLTVTRPI